MPTLLVAVLYCAIAAYHKSKRWLFNDILTRSLILYQMKLESSCKIIYRISSILSATYSELNGRGKHTELAPQPNCLLLHHRLWLVLQKELSFNDCCQCRSVINLKAYRTHLIIIYLHYLAVLKERRNDADAHDVFSHI